MKGLHTLEVMLVLLAGALVTSVVSQETHVQHLSWWQKAIVYQAYPRSFQDSDGDGVGDLNGVTERLNYLKYLGVGAVWMNPIFPSPMRDFGYDISNYTDVDPTFGTLQDLDNLLRAAHDAGLRVILDFVPNHCSDLHPWFQMSRRRVDPYTDYFIWTDADNVTNGPPNNWRSVFGGSAWSWDEERSQYFYHAFLREQPDLNWRSPHVVREMHDVLRFWLDRGVDGFRVDALQNLFETSDLSRDEPSSGRTDVLENSYRGLNHIWTFEQEPELGDAVRGWRDVLDEFEERDGFHRFLVAETSSETDITVRNQFYTYGADMPFNFDLEENVSRTCGGNCIQAIVDRELGHLQNGQWPNFVLGNHDTSRIGSKMGEEFVDSMNMLLLLLPGTPTTYYGEEIGMHDVFVPFDQAKDIPNTMNGEDFYYQYGRDKLRTPMQWDSSPQAGFTNSSSPWLPLAPDAREGLNNVQTQRASSQQTHLHVYRELSSLRQRPSFLNANLRYAVVNDAIFSFIRSVDAHGLDYLIAINFGTAPSTDDYSAYMSGGVVVLYTGSVSGSLEAGRPVPDLSSVTLAAGEGIVIRNAGSPIG